MSESTDHVDRTDHVAPQTTLSYEQARDELIDVVRQLESGNASLEESLRLWERGEELAATCQAWLDGARRRLEAAKNGSADHSPESDRAEPDE